ncbi:unnamed protein product, partial [Cylicocyclus nassatus]
MMSCLSRSFLCDPDGALNTLTFLLSPGAVDGNQCAGFFSFLLLAKQGRRSWYLERTDNDAYQQPDGGEAWKALSQYTFGCTLQFDAHYHQRYVEAAGRSGLYVIVMANLAAIFALSKLHK